MLPVAFPLAAFPAYTRVRYTGITRPRYTPSRQPVFTKRPVIMRFCRRVRCPPASAAAPTSTRSRPTPLPPPFIYSPNPAAKLCALSSLLYDLSSILVKEHTGWSKLCLVHSGYIYLCDVHATSIYVYIPLYILWICMHTYIRLCTYRRRRNDRTCRGLRCWQQCAGGRTNGRAETHRINTRRIHTTITTITVTHRYTFEPGTDGGKYQQLKWSSVYTHRAISSTCDTCTLCSGIKIHLLRPFVFLTGAHFQT